MEYGHYENGVPSWVDMQSPDLAAAKAFYAGLFGWNTPEGPPEAGGYSVCDIGGKYVAGLGPQMNPAFPPAWVTYVNVDSADDTIAKVEANGGTVFMGPMDVMEAGRLAVFADPAGAVIGLWQPKEHPGAQLVNEPGTYCWSELVTSDLDGSKVFYQAVFDWESAPMGPEAGPAGYTEVKVGGKTIAGMMAKPPDMPAEVPPYWGVYFAVADTDASVAKAESLGATINVPPTDIPPGRFSLMVDPVGAMVSILAFKSEE